MKIKIQWGRNTNGRYNYLLLTITYDQVIIARGKENHGYITYAKRNLLTMEAQEQSICVLDMIWVTCALKIHKLWKLAKNISIWK